VKESHTGRFLRERLFSQKGGAKVEAALKVRIKAVSGRERSRADAGA
jgi:hypothetical protein